MKFLTLTLILLATFATVVFAAPEPEPAKAVRYRAAQVLEDDTQDDFDDQNVESSDRSEIDAAVDSSKKGEASSGRLFLKRFLLFKNMFNQKPKQPIIPIIITGGGGLSPAPAAPTTPATTPTTGPANVPTGTGTAVNPPPLTTSLRDANNDNPPGRIQLYGRGDKNDRETDEESAAADEQTLAAALGAGAEEYVVTDQEIIGTSDAKVNRGSSLINLRHRGAKRAQIVSVRVPAQYRNYFKKGQRVILNNNNNKKPRPAKRRVVKRRNNRRRLNKNRPKRRLIVADNE